jgi:Flp pilus assembly protein TadG
LSLAGSGLGCGDVGGGARDGRAARRLVSNLADERGSSVVEFSMMSVLLVLLLFAVLQVAALFYIRSVASSAASDGARYAANAGVSPEAGGDRASTLLARALSPAMARRLPCAGELVTDPGSGLVTAQVRCQGNVRSLFLPIGTLVTVKARGQSLKDDP